MSLLCDLCLFQILSDDLYAGEERFLGSCAAQEGKAELKQQYFIHSCGAKASRLPLYSSLVVARLTLQSRSSRFSNNQTISKRVGLTLQPD